MNKNKIIKNVLNASSLSLLALVVSANLSATPLSVITVAPQQADLMSIAAPDYQVEHQAVHFSQKVSVNSKLSLKAKGYENVSDEYWLEVTGEQLNKGLNIAISSPGALIRLSGKQVNGEMSALDLAIDPKQVQLFKNKQALVKPFKQTVSQQQFATANIFPNSSAMQLDKSMGKGNFTLQVSQSLNAQQHYMINVKEKNSPYKLHLSIAKQSYLAGEKITLDSFINRAVNRVTNKSMVNKSTAKLAHVTNNAYIKTPNGEKFSVNLQKHNGKFQVQVPSSSLPAKRGALYELYVSSQANDHGLKIRRNAKVAFAIAQPTARMQGNYSVNNTAAKVKLNVASEGRYEVSGLVYGTSKNGVQLPIMLSRSAYYLQPGEQEVQLKFDQKILAASGLKAPFTVKQLRLMDQSRMALLQQL
ncbi:MAG: DUF4785 family protein [Alteromonadaceae bacterium]|nr:DUF4785 family protein [Alteromonadaceae bacterium]